LLSETGANRKATKYFSYLLSIPLLLRREIMSKSAILFYSTRENYGEFSNFAAFPIQVDGRTWPTSEHYFQAQKFAGTEHEEAIRTTPSAMMAAKMGRDRMRPLRADWEQVKNQIMLAAVRAKFDQHPHLGAILLATADAQIVEHTSTDSYWGDGGDGSGLNMLGQILMQVRAELAVGISRSDVQADDGVTRDSTNAGSRSACPSD
jgi:N-glycosidase YbiA